MPQNVVDADTWTATVQCRADGESVDGAGQLLMAQDLADRTKRLYNRSIETIGGELPFPINAVLNYDSRFEWGSAATPPANWAWDQIDVTDEGGLYIPIPDLWNCTFTSVQVRCEGSAGHGGLVGTPPQISLLKCDTSAGTMSTVGTQADLEVVGGNYENPHNIVLTVAAQAFNVDTKYYLLFKGEAGANKQVGLLLYNASITVVAA